jgi:hypothetical protein
VRFTTRSYDPVTTLTQARGFGPGSTTPAFQQQVIAALMLAASQIQAEDPGTANHDQRIRWAQYVYEGPARVAELMLTDAVQNTTLQGEYAASSDKTCPDGDVQFVVNSLVDKYAARFAGG